MNSKVTVIGAGNGGVTAAYHFSKNGHQVCIYDDPRFDAQIKGIQAKGGIEALKEDHGCEMAFSGFETIAKATTDIKEAMEFSDICVMICPSFAQEILFKDMLPHIKKGQIILLMPGNYGGLVLNKMLKEANKEDLGVVFADAISIPWACRVVEPGVITIMGMKEFLPLSIMASGDRKAEVAKRIEEVLPLPIEVLENTIAAGLENINFGGHPLLTTLNMGILENFDGDFNYYKDCCSTATANAAAAMDLERLSVGKALGLHLRTELDAMNSLYACSYETVYEFNRASVTHGKINKAPNSSKSRYITEDVAYLLVPCFELATLCELRVPIVESCIHIASAYNGVDYFKEGRTLAKMGLGNLNQEEVKAFLLNQGE